MKKLKKPLKQKSKKRTKKVKDNLPHIPMCLRKIIASDVKRFLTILGLNAYKARIFYQKDSPKLEQYEQIHGSIATASAHVDMRYLTVDINIYPFLVDQWNSKNFNEEDIHNVISHEISHVATNHLYRMATSVFKDEGELVDSWESLTTLIGRLVNRIDLLEAPLTNGKDESILKK